MVVCVGLHCLILKTKSLGKVFLCWHSCGNLGELKNKIGGQSEMLITSLTAFSFFCSGTKKMKIDFGKNHLAF